MNESLCKRCGKPFIPSPTGFKNAPMSTCCKKCKVLNLIDGLGLPTPPEMLDKYSQRPTLTREEFHRELNKPDNENLV